MNMMSLDQLVELLDGDRELLRQLVEEGLVEESAEGFAPEQVDRVLVACTLLRDLEVNWAGVEIILQLRDELMTIQRRLVAWLVQHPDSDIGAGTSGTPGGM